MLGWVLSVLSACNAPDPLRGLPSPPLNEVRSEVLALDRREGAYLLPSTNLPPGAELPDALVLEGVKENRGGAVRFWRSPLPFEVRDHEDSHFAPPGLRVRYEGTELPWRLNFPRQPDQAAWRLSEGRLDLYLPHLGDGELPAPGSITVEHAAMAARARRLDVAHAGLEPSNYVRFRHVVGEQDRAGLLLPAPASARWKVRIPAGGRFTARLALVRPPTQPSASDGAAAVLRIHDGGTSTDASRQFIAPDAPDFAPWDVDLAPWAGREVELEIATEQVQTSLHDYVFVAEPRIDFVPDALPRRVIVLAVDTLRPDHLSFFGYKRRTSPEIDAFAAESVVFDTAYAPAPRTRPSFRTATTGRWPLEAVGASNLGSAFQRHGFATAGIVANVHLNPRFDFHAGYDLWWLDAAAKANDQVDRATAWLEEHRLHDSFLFLHLMDPHLPYNAPDGFRTRYVTDPDPQLPDLFSRWTVLGWQRKGELNSRRKEHIEALYDGEVAWTSSEVGRLLTSIDSLPGRTVIVFHSDHGEEFWEHHGFEHNHTLYDEVVRAALWFRLPDRKGARSAMPASLADIGPTLHELLGLDDVPPMDGTSLMPWLKDANFTTSERLLPIGYLRYDRERWGVVVDGHKYILFTDDGREELYNLQEDPGEKHNLAPTADLDRFRVALGAAHGIDVGPGWRVAVRLTPGKGPVRLELPQPCLSAGVIDPESTASRPVNQEWGEVPPRTPADVGSVALSPDRRTLTFTPGREGFGLLYVRFDRSIPPEGTLRRGAEVLPLKSEGPGRRVWTTGDERVAFTEGTVVVPPLDEAVRMAEVAKKNAPAAASELDMLQKLGYIGDEK
jgi:arylsulfatase A-like enzyme